MYVDKDPSDGKWYVYNPDGSKASKVGWSSQSLANRDLAKLSNGAAPPPAASSGAPSTPATPTTTSTGAGWQGLAGAIASGVEAIGETAASAQEQAVANVRGADLTKAEIAENIESGHYTLQEGLNALTLVHYGGNAQAAVDYLVSKKIMNPGTTADAALAEAAPSAGAAAADATGAGWWNAPITQGYGPTSEQLDSGYAGYPNFNKGIDYAVPEGTPIPANITGTVIAAGDQGDGWGISVKVQDANGYIHNYGHLSAANVTVGQAINLGDVLGASGNTGASTGPHLSYDVQDPSGQYIEPSAFVQGLEGTPAAAASGGSVLVTKEGKPPPLTEAQKQQQAAAAYDAAQAQQRQMLEAAKAQYEAQGFTVSANPDGTLLLSDTNPNSPTYGRIMNAAYIPQRGRVEVSAPVLDNRIATGPGFSALTNPTRQAAIDASASYSIPTATSGEGYSLTTPLERSTLLGTLTPDVAARLAIMSPGERQRALLNMGLNLTLGEINAYLGSSVAGGGNLLKNLGDYQTSGVNAEQQYNQNYEHFKSTGMSDAEAAWRTKLQVEGSKLANELIPATEYNEFGQEIVSPETTYTSTIGETTETLTAPGLAAPASAEYFNEQRATANDALTRAASALRAGDQNAARSLLSGVSLPQGFSLAELGIFGDLAEQIMAMLGNTQPFVPFTGNFRGRGRPPVLQSFTTEGQGPNLNPPQGQRPRTTTPPVVTPPPVIQPPSLVDDREPFVPVYRFAEGGSFVPPEPVSIVGDSGRKYATASEMGGGTEMINFRPMNGMQASPDVPPPVVDPMVAENMMRMRQSEEAAMKAAMSFILSASKGGRRKQKYAPVPLGSTPPPVLQGVA